MDKKFKNKKQEKWGKILVPIHKNWWKKAYDKIRMKISNWKTTTGLKREILEELVINKYGSNCIYCGAELTWKNMGLDHKYSQHRGGTDKKKNLQIICQRCNRRKSIMHHPEYKKLLKFITKNFDKDVNQYILGQLSKKNF